MVASTKRVYHNKQAPSRKRHVSTRNWKNKKASLPSDNLADVRLANEETFQDVWNNDKDNVWDKY
jgi:hypothetical protein